MLTVIVCYVLLNLQKLIHEIGHFVMARRAGIVVEEFGIGYRPRLLKLGQRQDTAYTLNALLFGGFIKLWGEKDANVSAGFASKSKGTRFKVLAVGPILNLITLGIFVTPAIIFFTLAFLSGAPEPIMGLNAQGKEAPIARTVIVEVLDRTPAAEAGLQASDVILGADNVSFRYADDMPAYIEKVVGTEVTLHVERGGQEIMIDIVPRAHPPENQGPLGVTLRYEGIEYNTVRYSLLPALGRAVTTTTRFVWIMVRLPYDVYRGYVPAEEARWVGAGEVAQ
jgi:regulator of sigma E protease